MHHPTKKGIVIFPSHGSKEIGKGLEKKIKKDAGLNWPCIQNEKNISIVQLASKKVTHTYEEN